MKQLSKSYKQEKIEGDFDVIVIGSGLGGLSTAGFLAKEKKKVLVLERHYTPGGFTHAFTRKGYEWDVGVHYIGEVNREKTDLSKAFRYLTDGKMKWEEMDAVYDKMFFGKDQYEIVAGPEEFKARLKSYFPEEKKAIDEYLELIYKTQRGQKLYFGEKLLPGFLSKVIGNLFRRKGLKGNTSTLKILQSLTKNKQLIAVLTGQFGDYGLPPVQSSFLMHSALVKHYMKGASYPVGGAQQIFQTIAPAILHAGGEIFTNAEVKEIILKNGKAIGVKMTDGKDFFAEKIVSDAGINNTFNHLLPPEKKKELNISGLFENLKPSVGHICLYIGINHPNSELKHGKANYWIFPDNYDHDANIDAYIKNPDAEIPVIYISFPSSKDPDWENRYPGKTTIEIITLAPYAWYEKWEETRWMKRGEEYETFKENLSQKLLNALFQKHPELKGKIDHYELSTPLSTKNFANYEQGELYGIDHSIERFEQKFLKPQTPVKNLFLTGQDIVSCGIAGAMFSGVLTASVICRKNLMNRFKNS